MVVRKRKKNSRMRGSHTHGWGSKKKHRGAGNRGGRGMAGSGKRADQRKSWIYKYEGPDYFGKRGFSRPQQMQSSVRAINIADLPKDDTINLTELGYDKLLSMGTIKRKVTITVASCSSQAKAKIEQAGGKVLLPA